jgi:hypothetical protein
MTYVVDYIVVGANDEMVNSVNAAVLASVNGVAGPVQARGSRLLGSVRYEPEHKGAAVQLASALALISGVTVKLHKCLHGEGLPCEIMQVGPEVESND